MRPPGGSQGSGRFSASLSHSSLEACRDLRLEARHRVRMGVGLIAMASLSPVLLLGGAMMLALGHKPLCLHGKPLSLAGKDVVCTLGNLPEWRRAEVPSANGHASARALATVAAAILHGGAVPGGGTRLLSAEGAERAQADPIAAKMFPGIGPLAFGNAGWCDWGEHRSGYTGWMGLGGSVTMWHRAEQIAFGYANNAMQPMPLNHVGRQLQEEVLACAVEARSGDPPAPRGEGA